ncbi:MAG: Crp/Fnr family transcriptional regulator [Clostridiales bacterium]|nr:Crp/Fnr family transcriptional regulator [Clostridiales bacterium]
MNYNLLVKTELFRGISEDEAEAMIKCLQARHKSFNKGEFIYRAGDIADSMGLVISGGVNIENDDIWGNKSIINHAGRGQVFAETYACVPNQAMMVNVVAAEQTEVLFLNTEKMLKTCPSSCSFHARLIRNLLSVTALKNMHLSRRIFHTTPKTIRGKLLSYLSDQAMQQGKYKFTIPFDRQQLADYLGVDRSAMSNELGKMKREGLLDFTKNSFQLLEAATKEGGFH